MDLSVVIVSYNAVNFLRLTLQSVQSACKDLSVEVIVVDNNSTDNSVQMVEDEFPQFRMLSNKHNPGFSVANNQGINIAKGRYILLLNPDTVLAEDSFVKILRFMDLNKDVGGCGVRMLDGKGNFLPESKRGVPSIWNSICKLFGLSKLFAKTKMFDEYNKGYLNDIDNHQIEVLSGAFLLVRKKVVDLIGGLDERFFMYGEDIDFSYRIILSGYKNYYLSDTSIIHFKGESTVKDEKYIQRFYHAMILYAKKHFSKKQGYIFNSLIVIGIYFAKFVFQLKCLMGKRNNSPKKSKDRILIIGEDKKLLSYFENGILINEEQLEFEKGGILVFPLFTISFKKMIRLMDKYKNDFHFRFFDKTHRILLGSDLRNDKGVIFKV